MRTISERVYLYKKNFIRLHNEGYSIPEITQKYSLSRSTGYRLLTSIAAENNVSRESLLQEVHKTPSFWEREVTKVRTDADELINTLDTSIAECEAILGEIELLHTSIKEVML